MPCGGGKQWRIREVIRKPQGKGAACPALEQWEACNTQECRFAPQMQELSKALGSFSGSEPVLDAVKSEYEGFKGLVKTSHDIDDPHGREWVEFVDGVRATSKEYREGERLLTRALIGMMNFAKQAPKELGLIFSELCTDLIDRAQFRYGKFLSKFSDIRTTFESIDRHFGKIEADVKDIPLP